MKIFLILFLISVSALVTVAQNKSVEKTFEKSKPSLSVTRFGFGEDASSGWDYLVYRQKTSTKKIRVIWSNYERATVDDYYYEAGKPVLLVKHSAKHSHWKSLAKGANLPVKVLEKFYFADAKLVTWEVSGKQVPATDPRWAEKEKELLESFNSQLETFRMHLKGEL